MNVARELIEQDDQRQGAIGVLRPMGERAKLGSLKQAAKTMPEFCIETLAAVKPPAFDGVGKPECENVGRGECARICHRACLWFGVSLKLVRPCSVFSGVLLTRFPNVRRLATAERHTDAECGHALPSPDGKTHQSIAFPLDYRTAAIAGSYVFLRVGSTRWANLVNKRDAGRP